MVRELDGKIGGAVEQEIGIGGVGHEVFVGIEARLLRHIDARKGERSHILLATAQRLAVGGRKPIAIGGHERQPILATQVATKDPFALCHEGQGLDGLVGGFDVTSHEAHIVLVVDKFGIFSTRVIVETILACADMVVDVAVDALIEHAGFYREQAVSPLRAQHGFVASLTL